MGARRVIIIPDGSLHRLPFDALVVSAPAADGGPRYWLDVGPAVSYTPSATALERVTRRELKRRSQPSAEYEIVSLSAAGHGGGAGASRGSLGAPLRDLPWSGEEAKRIEGAFGARVPETRLAFLRGPEATERNARRLMGRARYLHFATHGIVDRRINELFAALALTPSSRMAASDDDGLLQLSEIYGLSLRADLAALSACDGGVGRAIEGEGTFALSTGFLVAGASRTVASLWEVSDESTAALMSGLFAQIATLPARPASGEYSTALADAKKSIRNQTRWAAPHHWAGFFLVGAP